MTDNDERLLAGALYASCNGYQVWLRYDDKLQSSICLEPLEIEALAKYLQSFCASKKRLATDRNVARRREGERL